MQVTLPSELARQVAELVEQGAYPTADAAVADALEEMLLRRNELDPTRLATLLQEAETSGHTEMTAQDWEDIERDGLAILQSGRRP